VEELARAFERTMVAWIVGGEIAHAILGGFACPRPTAAREEGDDTWTPEEQSLALLTAPSRMARATAADDWATRYVLWRGGSTPPVLALLDVMARVEQSRRPDEIWPYLALHPRSDRRLAAVRSLGATWRGGEPRLDSTPGGPGMR
jgi:hypothetical protein